VWRDAAHCEPHADRLEKQGAVRTSQQRITIPDIAEIQKRCEEERA